MAAPRPEARTARRWPWLVAAAAVVVIAAMALGLVTLHRRIGYFAPAFAPDGASVVVVERRTRGIAWGMGWEFFTPPAHAYAASDELRLLRVSLDGRQVEVLERWPFTPVAHRTLRQYRGRLFNHLAASVQPRADGSIEYGFEFALLREPTSEAHQLHGVWSLEPAQRMRGEWRRSPLRTVGTSDPSIAGQRELFALPGPEGFPAAVVVLDHAQKRIDVVIAAADYDANYPNGASLAQLMPLSRKAAHDRVQEISRLQKASEAGYLAQGASPGDAALKSWREVRDLGYLPTPPRWVAQPIAAAEAGAAAALPRFDIDEMEFKVGLMRDIAQAIAQPGAAVDKDGGRYITHRDYPNAQRLNAVLESGATEIVVGHRGATYRLRLLPREEARK